MGSDAWNAEWGWEERWGLGKDMWSSTFDVKFDA